MIIKTLVVIAGLILLAFVFERLITKFSHDNEPLRKLVHVSHGIGLALVAFILPLQVLALIEVFFLVSMFGARYLYEQFKGAPWIKYFARVYKVGRLSYGEFFYPISVILLVFIADSEWEFAASILVLALADAVAALIGKRFGKSNSYNILGQKKSLAGSFAFLAVTMAIIGAFVAFSGADVTDAGLGAVIWVSLLLTITENLGVYGSDNFLIPLVAVALLNHL